MVEVADRRITGREGIVLRKGKKFLIP